MSHPSLKHLNLWLDFVDFIPSEWRISLLYEIEKKKLVVSLLHATLLHLHWISHLFYPLWVSGLLIVWDRNEKIIIGAFGYQICPQWPPLPTNGVTRCHLHKHSSAKPPPCLIASKPATLHTANMKAIAFKLIDLHNIALVASINDGKVGPRRCHTCIYCLKHQ